MSAASRFSIPPGSSREDIAPNFNFAFHAANEISAIGICGNHSRDCLPMFGNYNALGIKILQQGKALFFEFGSIDRQHVLKNTLNGDKYR
jgi:hypothetical protein